MKIAIVNDQNIAVVAIRRALEKMLDWDVVWVAEDGAQAVEQVARSKPDLILMDLVMPIMDGVEATRRIMRDHPCHILLVTSSIDINFKLVFDAMGYGALDAVNTPTPGQDGNLLQKIAEIGQRIKAAAPVSENSSSRLRLPTLSGTRPLRSESVKVIEPVIADLGLKPSGSTQNLGPLLVIGASTGGPQAVATVLNALPKPFVWPIVVIQHLGKEFTAGLAQHLHEITGFRTTLALEGEKPEVGCVYLCATDDHLVLNNDGCFHYTAEPRLYAYRPSVDVFFRSLLKFDSPEKIKTHGVAVLLTGMGRDGAAGLLELKQRGWHTITQNKASCVIYGMPKAAEEIGAACEVLALSDIGAAISRQVG